MHNTYLEKFKITLTWLLKTILPGNDQLSDRVGIQGQGCFLYGIGLSFKFRFFLVIFVFENSLRREIQYARKNT